ncbi:MAG TPA: GNAT family N-acetyltransferase [Arenimonas sp.]|nr:GNAT family N-acetyltransferase [Arenimonas sp.]
MALPVTPDKRRRQNAPSPEPAGAAAERLPTLAAPRLCLRWIEPADLGDLYAVFSDPEVMRFWSHAAWPHQDEAEIYLESIHRGFEQGDLFQWGIALRATDQVIGTATLYAIDHAQGRAELGFALARAHWGRRYAREALTVLIGHAFDALGLRRLEADVDPRNQGSLRTLEALGFLREGYLRQRWRVAGELQDSVVMGLLASEWPPRH